MTSSKSAKGPKGWEAFYAGLTGMTDRFCTEHLNDEYADLARSAIAALCRKRPSPLAGGSTSNASTVTTANERPVSPIARAR